MKVKVWVIVEISSIPKEPPLEDVKLADTFKVEMSVESVESVRFVGSCLALRRPLSVANTVE